MWMLHLRQMQQQKPTLTEDELDQTHCSVCSKHLRGRGVRCSICGFVHLKHTPLPSSIHWKPGLICNRCLPDSVVLADDIPPQDLTHTVSAPEHTSSGLSQLMGDLRIENVPPDSEACTYLRKLFSTRVPILKRVPKGARVNLACLYSEVIIDISKHPYEVFNWLKLMSIPAHCLKATDRGGKNTEQTSPVQSTQLKDLFPAQLRFRSSRKEKAKPKKETESLWRRVQEKIDDGNIRGSIWIASRNDTMPEITPEIVNEMEEKQPRHKFAYAVQGNEEQEWDHYCGFYGSLLYKIFPERLSRWAW